MRHGDGDGDGKGQQGDRRYNDGATGDTTTCHDDGDGTTTARGSTATCGTTTATGGSTAMARGSRATGGTKTVTGDTARRHDEGDARRTTTIRYFILVRLAKD